MFRFHKTLDVVTLFHRPSVASSVRVNSLLKRLSAEATETATEDQAADHSHQNKIQRSQFELNVTEDAPTGDQLRNLIEYVGSEAGGKGPVEVAGMLVQGAKNEKDAIRRLSEDSSKFKWPVTVDWNNGRAVVGEDESQITRMIGQLPKQ